jgi:hypothetical protein
MTQLRTPGNVVENKSTEMHATFRGALQVPVSAQNYQLARYIDKDHADKARLSVVEKRAVKDFANSFFVKNEFPDSVPAQ